MKKKENHIWPAYVDMMTVLLLVYVLVSLLFATMIKQDTEAQYEEKLNSLMSLKVTSAIGPDGANPHMSTGNQASDLQPEEVMTDENTDMLARRDGDLILTLNPGAEKLTSTEQVKITDWYQKNRREIENKGVYFAVIAKKDSEVSVGALYRKQYMLYMDTLRYLVKTQHDFKPANFLHRSPLPVGDLPEEYVVMRTANAQ